jgi:SAM-dependent methyltransferase
MAISPKKHYFNENYVDYELQTSEPKLEFYLNLLRKWVPPGRAIFELGVGKGHFFQKAFSQYDCEGCDINEFGLEVARSKVPDAKLFWGSYECIPTDRAPYAVVAWDVLEHIPELDKALSVIYSRLEAGGFLIAIVPVYDGPLGWLVEYLDRDPTHVFKLSRREWIEKLKSHHFQLVETGAVIRKLIMSRWYLHLTRPRFMLRRIGSAYYFVAQKG